MYDCLLRFSKFSQPSHCSLIIKQGPIETFPFFHPYRLSFISMPIVTNLTDLVGLGPAQVINKALVWCVWGHFQKEIIKGEGWSGMWEEGRAVSHWLGPWWNKGRGNKASQSWNSLLLGPGDVTNFAPPFFPYHGGLAPLITWTKGNLSSFHRLLSEILQWQKGWQTWPIHLFLN